MTKRDASHPHTRTRALAGTANLSHMHHSRNQFGRRKGPGCGGGGRGQGGRDGGRGQISRAPHPNASPTRTTRTGVWTRGGRGGMWGLGTRGKRPHPLRSRAGVAALHQQRIEPLGAAAPPSPHHHRGVPGSTWERVGEESTGRVCVESLQTCTGARRKGSDGRGVWEWCAEQHA